MFGLGKKKKKISFISKSRLRFKGEDGGLAMIADAEGISYDGKDENGLFVRIQSWDEN